MISAGVGGGGGGGGGGGSGCSNEGSKGSVGEHSGRSLVRANSPREPERGATQEGHVPP